MTSRFTFVTLLEDLFSVISERYVTPQLPPSCILSFLEALTSVSTLSVFSALELNTAV